MTISVQLLTNGLRVIEKENDLFIFSFHSHSFSFKRSKLNLTNEFKWTRLTVALTLYELTSHRFINYIRRERRAKFFK